MLGKDQPSTQTSSHLSPSSSSATAAAAGHDGAGPDAPPALGSTIKSSGNLSVAETGVEIAADFVCAERFADNF
ncbi:hypothetical protein LPJ75_003887, partial [Coemansia sp. RSA 2598]